MSTGIGIIGCGNISGIYCKNLSTRFPELRLVACADARPERAWEQAEKFGIEALGVEELLARKDIDIVVNLTIPLVHAEVSAQILRSGKHVYSEKPLSVTVKDGTGVLALARELGLQAGGAPDTFLGAGIQTCRRLVESGAIGEVVGGIATMLCPGHEGWHPDPAFYYAPGGGPVLDMGPYYLTALTELLGPMAGVTGYARTVRDRRTVGSGPKKGEQIEVKVPTHAAGVLRFESGPIVSLVMSFEVHSHRMPFIELWGTEGSLAVPDPNTFGGPVFLCRRGEKDWVEQPVSGGPSDNARGIGVEDMARALASGRPARASGNRCLHVLAAMEGLHESALRESEVNLADSAEAFRREREELA